MKINEVTQPTFHISYQDISYSDLVREFGNHKGMEIYEQYYLSGKKLIETHSPTAISQFNSLSGVTPSVGNYYYGISIAMTFSDDVELVSDFYGKLLSINKVPTSTLGQTTIDAYDQYVIEFSTGETVDFPNKKTGQLLQNTLLYSSEADYNNEKINLSLIYSLSFGPIRK